jgi:hypothetical protein
MIARIQKSLRKRFGHSAPQLTVRARMSPRAKLAIGGGVLALMGALVWGGFDYGRILAGFNVGKIEEERKAMAEQITSLSGDNEVLRKRNIELENDAKIALGAKGAISQQLVGLQTEVTQLREEVAFFQKLTAGTVKDGALAIQKLQLQPEDDGQTWRVRALVTQGGSGASEFKGQLQLAVNVVQDGKRSTLMLPEEQKETAESLKLAFKTYQRVETTFRVPAGGQVKAVQAKLMERNSSAPRAQMNVNL